MQNKSIAIIGASYLQLPLINRAKELGYTTHVFAWAANDVGEEAADFFYPISIVCKEEILEKCKAIGICGICSIASDLAAITVNYVAYALGLPCNTPDAAAKSTNKHLMRKAFENGGDPSPRSILIDEATDVSQLALDYPVIVKPTDRSGSRGIFKVEKKEELQSAIICAMENGFEKKALVEEFAEGIEYSIEHISYRGKHHFLAATLKYTTGAPHFIETGHMEPAELSDEILEKVKKTCDHALDTLGINYGASHTEIKIDAQGNIKIIEIGGRMGGDCIGSDLVRYSTGLDFIKMVIDVAVGKEPDFTQCCQPQPVEVKFIFTQVDLAELERLQRDEPDQLIRIVNLKPENIGKTTDSSNRAGCYIRKYKGDGN